MSAAVADVLAALKGPFKFGLWGLRSTVCCLLRLQR
ncbi:hypothetical protein OVX87_33240 [Klebsiella pneumoniae]|nr:hypothetical protein [Klebsiella pneumoniae]MCY0629680.1 hypothetical protein [Klebsiella pneumoniae]MCY0629700.1 hypothetical protein [Klebsiella pneumoniae]MCY0629714.1 hypothetical protein [Klebsiella pneumoniae]